MDVLSRFLQSVATHATDSYLLEDVLRQRVGMLGSCNSPANLTLDKILFLVMCSVDKKERVEWLNQTWLSWLPQQNVILLSNASIPGYSMTILPSLPADEYIATKFGHPIGYHAANLRHLKAIQWLGMVNTTILHDIHWIVMVDDDTFVNLPLLLMFLQDLPASLPLMLGHLWDSAWFPQWKGLAWPAGGAGMVFTKEAFHRLAVVLFTPSCNMGHALNDITIGYCTVAANVTKVHTRKFLPERINGIYNPSIHDVGMAVTMHRAVDRQHQVSSTCVVSKRFGWPHPLCSNYSIVCNPACHA